MAAARWQQPGGCGGFTDTVHECTNAHAFECHQRANIRVFIIGRGWRDDSANGIVVFGRDGGARGEVHRGCQCTVAANEDAADNDTADSSADADADANANADADTDSDTDSNANSDTDSDDIVC
jgi:hypothetical protein